MRVFAAGAGGILKAFRKWAGRRPRRNSPCPLGIEKRQMMKAALSKLVSDLPEIYQPIYHHADLSLNVSRQCTDRLETIVAAYDALQGVVGRPLRLLDLGCAQGFFSLSLAGRGAVVHGVDVLYKNIAVCKALLAESAGLDATFEVARIEDIVARLEPDRYDLVLGLSVFHHIAHKRGADKVREMFGHIARCAGVLAVETALREEPLYWGAAQPRDPRSLLEGFAFVHQTGQYGTHLSTIKRPLYFASNRYWLLGDHVGMFDSWTTEPHAAARGVHQSSRRYYFNDRLVVKHFRLDHPCVGARNRKEILGEISFLASAPAGFVAPACLASGVNEKEGWTVVERKPGRLLLDILRDGADVDRMAVLKSVLDQLSTLEAANLCHDDVRAWNILVSDGKALLIDYGSISENPRDCSWPANPFLAFFIFAYKLAAGVIDPPDPIRMNAISPGGLPQPYHRWASALWEMPLRQWSFKWMRELLEGDSDAGQGEEAEARQETWSRAIEKALQIQTQSERYLDQSFHRLSSLAKAEAALQNVYQSRSWVLARRLGDYHPKGLLSAVMRHIRRFFAAKHGGPAEAKPLPISPRPLSLSHGIPAGERTTSPEPSRFPRSL